MAFGANPDKEDLKEALLEVAGNRGAIEGRRLSWYARRFDGRQVDGLKFERAQAGKYDQWRVIETRRRGINGVTGISYTPTRESVSDKLEIGGKGNTRNAVNAPLPPEVGEL